MYSDIIGTISLLIAIVGFAITIHNVKASKRAAEDARSAAQQIGQQVRITERLHNLEKTLLQIDTVRTLNAQGSVPLEYLQQIKSSLIQFNSISELTTRENRIIQKLITALGVNEDYIARSNNDEDELNRINTDIRARSESVSFILHKLKEKWVTNA